MADAWALWRNLPVEHRRRARFVTDFWEAYDKVIPPARHFQVGKGEPSGAGTQKIERFNNTLRQRRSRLVRKSLPFAKKLDNHIGAIWNFVHHYNESLPA